MGLVEYRRKRHFDKTPEPRGSRKPTKRAQRFVIQKHAASRLHYDFRLELDGVLKSWAVPKGPSLDPSIKSLAVHVEDHPIEYGKFEGVIPQGEYGGGTVMLWDHGTWEAEGDPRKDYQRGKLTFTLHGEKLNGRWTLIRMGGSAGDGGKNWLLKKLDDKYARPIAKYNVLEEMSSSITSGRTMEQIAGVSDRVWTRQGELKGKKAKSKTVVKASTSRRSGGRKAARKKSSASRRGRGKQSAENGHAGNPRTETKRFDASALTNARLRPIPRIFSPQLATLVRSAPEGDDWLHELKYDGYRLLCFLEGGKVKLVTRHGNDWTSNFSSVAEGAANLGCEPAILDGEVVVLGTDGTSDFQALQNHMKRGREETIVYFAFDLPFCDGYDLTATPLVERKELLKQVLADLPENGPIRFSDHIVGRGPDVLRSACEHGLEGVVSKRADSRYEQKRSGTWVKSKCLKRQEFVIGGWSDPGGSREAFGSLLLGYYDDQGRLIHAGRVGTGFTNDSLQQIKAALDRLQTKECPFHVRPAGRDTHWVSPRLVAEVAFTQWTEDGQLRHPTFQGLREDKLPRDVKREEAVTMPPTPERKVASRPSKRPIKKIRKKPATSTTGSPANNEKPLKVPDTDTFAGVKLSNPDRVQYPESKITKRELAEYYSRVADWILPHLVHRPITLVRCPQGRQSKCFYQKHVNEGLPDAVRGIEVQEKDGIGIYVTIDDLKGVISLVQMGVLEMHPWGSREDKIDFPDRIILDLDPGEEVEWAEIVEAAEVMRQRLGDLKLESFLRTTGGKGLHVVVPILRRLTWDEAKEFAREVAKAFVRWKPDKFIDTASKARRRGKIYIDYLRNDRGSTAIASYSTRARPGATVATPLDWSELTDQLEPARFTIRTVPDRLNSLKRDPWRDYFQVKQAISKSALRQVKSW